MRGLWLALFPVTLGAALLLPQAGILPAPGQANAIGAISGDANCDSATTIDDVVFGMNAIADVGPDGCLESSGDVNCSGAADLVDMVTLLRHIAGLPTGLPDGCPAIGSETGGDEGPTSSEKIEEALANGEITKGQALLYHLYADLAVDGLPAAYQGAISHHVEGRAFYEIATAWGTLSDPEKVALTPFVLPPTEPGSWVEMGNVGEGFSGAAAIQWETIGNSDFKVWWQTRRPEDAAKAAGILEELSSYIAPEIMDYMGEEHAPLSDASYPASGGDGRYDIYLVHNVSDDPAVKPVLGWVAPHLDPSGNNKCEMTPSYMVLNSRGALTPAFLSTVAHEFMHSVQFSYNVGLCEDYRWMKESTATWAESWLYPDVDEEHKYAESYLGFLKVPLEHWEYLDLHQYGSYLFWYYLQHKEGMFSAVSDAWAASAEPNSLRAVDTALAANGGLKELWAKSALYNWNRDPFDEFLFRDGLTKEAPFNDTQVDVNGGPVSFPVSTSLGHMRQQHFHYMIMDNVKSLQFENPFAGADEEYAKVQAIVKINGQWEAQARDWTDAPRPYFCLDKPEEKVEELVIVLTNSNWIDRFHTFNVGDGTLKASPVGCKGWVGTATAEVYYFDTTFSITVEGMRFEPRVNFPVPPGTGIEAFDLVEIGDATWHVSGTWPGGCTPSGTMPLGQPGSEHEAHGSIGVDVFENDYSITAGGANFDSRITITCANGDSVQLPWPSIPFIDTGFVDVPFKDEGGTLVMDGEYVNPSPVYGGTWRWRLTELE